MTLTNEQLKQTEKEIEELTYTMLVFSCLHEISSQHKSKTSTISVSRKRKEVLKPRKRTTGARSKTK